MGRGQYIGGVPPHRRVEPRVTTGVDPEGPRTKHESASDTKERRRTARSERDNLSVSQPAH